MKATKRSRGIAGLGVLNRFGGLCGVSVSSCCRRLENTLYSARTRFNTGQGEDRDVWGVASVLTRRGKWHDSEDGL